jgi:hypothetical protein
MTNQAQAAMKSALEVGIEDAMSLYHAGVISRNGGDTLASKKYFQRSLEVNPHSRPRTPYGRPCSGSRLGDGKNVRCSMFNCRLSFSDAPSARRL